MSTNPEQKFHKIFGDTEIIADPLNRLISLSLFEKRIICCPEFQRLRRIKQLGFANFVYPAAEYTRFVHSLGACHQAKNIVDTVNRNVKNQPMYRRWRIFGRGEGSLPTSEYDTDSISKFERVVISAAALLHDLPHGPFSHEIEGIPGKDDKPLIPDHDNLQENPALFLYLFDKEVSDLALILDYFNAEFSEAICGDAQKLTQEPITKEELVKNPDWRYGIKWLLQEGLLTKEGTLRISGESPISPFKGGEQKPPYAELPLLPALIFEILLFEKQKEWFSAIEQKTTVATSDWKSRTGVHVSMDWEGKTQVEWRPIPGWFRAYRKDIIGNTICADLIDYVSRDGYHTGIVSTMDLKFLDRMLIARATLPPLGDDKQPGLKPPPNRTAYNDIPVSCEHIVFDIYDHKRGFIRQSVLTEILAYLQGRYLLCERVYIHRVVEAARSMLQKAIAILCNIKRPDGKPLLSVQDLHPLTERGPGLALAPIGDDALLNWIRSVPILEADTYDQNREEMDKAIELATMLVERRVFREAIIFDGLHGFEHAGQLSGAKTTCRALEAAFLTDSTLTGRLQETLQKIEDVLGEDLASKAWKQQNHGNDRIEARTKALIGVRKWGKRYKPPLVLVARPLKYKTALHSALDIEPLLDCEDPPNIKKQLDAMKDSYDTLWKVYLFLHPVFHDDIFIKSHKKVGELLAKFAAENTGTNWRNAIDFNQLLKIPIDNVSFLAQKSNDRKLLALSPVMSVAAAAKAPLVEQNADRDDFFRSNDMEEVFADGAAYLGRYIKPGEVIKGDKQSYRQLVTNLNSLGAAGRRYVQARVGDSLPPEPLVYNRSTLDIIVTIVADAKAHDGPKES